MASTNEQLLEDIRKNVEKNVYDNDKKALCILFDQRSFPGPNNETIEINNEDDVKLLKEYFKGPKYEVDYHRDLTQVEIKKTLAKCKQSKYNEYSYVIVVVLTISKDKTYLGSKDHVFSLEVLFNVFTDFELFVGKPKIFFIQAPELMNPKDDIEMEVIEDEDDEINDEICIADIKQIVIPKKADFLVSISSHLGHNYIRILISELIKNERKSMNADKNEFKSDLMSILIEVQRQLSEISIDWDQDKKSMPLRYSYSTLTRKIYI